MDSELHSYKWFKSSASIFVNRQFFFLFLFQFSMLWIYLWTINTFVEFIEILTALLGFTWPQCAICFNTILKCTYRHLYIMNIFKFFCDDTSHSDGSRKRDRERERVRSTSNNSCIVAATHTNFNIWKWTQYTVILHVLKCHKQSTIFRHKQPHIHSHTHTIMDCFAKLKLYSVRISFLFVFVDAAIITVTVWNYNIIRLKFTTKQNSCEVVTQVFRS